MSNNNAIQLFVILIISMVTSGIVIGQELSYREKRAPVFPPFTVLQVAFGLAVPAQIPNRTVVTNLGALHNIPLPSKVSQLYPHARKHRQYTHDYFYKFLENVFSWNGYNSRECIRKSICQMSKIEFQNGDLLHELLHMLFSFSAIKNPIAGNHYFIAEQNGKNSKISCTELHSSFLSVLLPIKSDDLENARTLVISNGGIVKLIMGVAMPVELPVSLVWAQNIQFQYQMIDNAAQLTYLNLLRSSRGASLSRNIVYKMLAESWNRLGVNGTACVLRIICEVSRHSSSYTSILGKILRTTFTPHESTDAIYTRAAKNSLSTDNCKNYRSSCRKNIANLYQQKWP